MTDLREQLQTTLGTAYTLERELGGGGMSRVFVADEPRFGRKVVVKVLAPELAAGLSAERFEREIRTAAGLQQANIVPVLAAGESEGLPYYTMPYVDGLSLRARLADAERLDARETVSILRDVARALAYAHKHGIVHRDIKPENVLLSEGAAVVTDFGIAKAISASHTQGAQPGATQGGITQMGMALGTPAYMAPEQVAGDPNVDHRADLYALGCMAYELVTGQSPFGGRAPHLMAMAHMGETPRPVETLAPEVPPALATLVMRLLEKDPAQRPQSAAEVLQALDLVTTGGTGDRPATTRRVRRRALVVGGIALAAAAIGAVFLARRDGPVDDRVIAVVPFRVATPDQSLAYLREGMLDLLSTKLGGGGGGDALRTVDARVLLAAWRKAGGSETADPSPEASLALARELGAGELLSGSITGAPQRLTLSASLVNARTGKTIATPSVEGPSDSLPVLVDRLAAQLLSLRDGEETHRLASLTSTSLPALRAYLHGKSLMRHGRYPEAARQFSAALDLDSTFAVAGYALRNAAVWYGSGADQGRGARIAWRGRERLSPRDRAALECSIGTTYPRESTPRDRGAGCERLMALDPDSPESLFLMGDWNFHFAPALDVPDAWPRALALFERALRADSSFAPAWEHLPVLYAKAGRPQDVQRIVAHMERADSAAGTLLGNRIFAAFQRGDASATTRLLGELPNAPLASSLHLNTFFMKGLLPYAVARRGPEALAARAASTGESGIAHMVGILLALEAGRPAEAAAQMKRVAEARPPMALSVAVISAAMYDGDTAAASRAVATMETMLTARPPASAQERELFGVVALGRLLQGDTTRARRAIVALRAGVDTSDGGRMLERVASIYELQLEARVNSPRTRRLAERLDSITTDMPIAGFEHRMAYLTLARAYERLGDPKRALTAASRSTPSTGGPPDIFTTPALREQARLAVLAGERQRAVEALRHYIAMRSDAEPALRADLERAKRELARLERESGGR